MLGVPDPEEPEPPPDEPELPPPGAGWLAVGAGELEPPELLLELPPQEQRQKLVMMAIEAASARFMELTVKLQIFE